MSSVHNTPFVVGTTINQADISTATELVADTAGRTLSLKSLTISNLAAALVTIEENDGTDILTFPLPVRGGVARNWDPGEVPLAAGQGASALSSTSDAVTVHATFWYKDA